MHFDQSYQSCIPSIREVSINVPQVSFIIFSNLFEVRANLEVS